DKKERELIQQKKDALAQEESKRQKLVRNSLIIAIFLLLIIALVVFRSFLQKRKANRILNIQKKRIEDKNEQLHQQNEEIQQLLEELTSSNEQLLFQKEELEETVIKLQEMQTQLIQSEKMASVGILTAGIAHEINNPLNFIQGGKTALESYIDENLSEHANEILPILNIIDTGIRRTSEILQSLNSFSKKSESRSRNCDIHLVINNCLLMLNKQLKDKIEIIKNFTDVPSNIFGKEGDLHQAILNILINSIQSIKGKGIITINTHLKDENLILEIIDTGCGIKEEDIKKITVPFYTTKAPGDGTGLGMSIAYNIIKEHDGIINFISTEGSGTKVVISFPVM
ncbi:MAG: hypothetical protein JXR51_13930, partial [Bacteroidales bacterium]|nr:hypothetical protein [Bacteroidales bacterium]